MIELNGAYGEGGGQILRTSLALSLVTGRPFRIVDIRAKRKDPGLLRQHLTCVRAAAAVGQAGVTGDELGSSTLTFTPGRLKPGEYTFSIGTAGSTTLVLQTILLPLLLADGPSRLVLEGGTHNTHAPPFDFLVKAFVPLLQRMGANVSLQLKRYGFYPAGGGQIVVDIAPSAPLQPLTLEDRGEFTHRRAIGIVASLPRHIAQREVDTVTRMLNWPPETRETLVVQNPVGPGNVVMIELGNSTVTEVFSGFGRMGTPAERVAEEALAEAREYLASGAAVGEHLADQLLLPLALAGGGSYTATKLTLHTTTNIDTIRKFLPIRVDTEAAEGRGYRVAVHS